MNKLKVLVIDSKENNPNAWIGDIQKYLKEFVDLKIVSIRLPIKSPDWYKVMPAAVATIRCLRYINSYDCVLSLSVANGITFAILQKLFGKKIIRPKHVMLDVGITRVLGKSHDSILSIFKWIFSSVDAVVCYAVSSATFWRSKIAIKSLCRFIPLMAGDEYFSSHASVDEQGYILSAGRCGRDYRVLMEAVKGLSLRTIIVSDKETLRSVEESILVRPDIQAFTEIPHSEYMRLLAGARLVVLPLKQTEYHPGQTVLVQAMAMGKTIICSNANGTSDYVTDCLDVLLAQPGDIVELREKINWCINNPTMAEKLGKAARDRALIEYTERAFALKLFDTITQVIEEI